MLIWIIKYCMTFLELFKINNYNSPYNHKVSCLFVCEISMSEKKSADIDIFNLLSETPPPALKPAKKSLRQELLEPTGVKDLFKEGKININKHTCVGVQCKLCIKACPTNALYWKTGEVGIIEDLCVYCGACVLSCMVDDCIKIVRKRENGKTENFGKTRDVILLANGLNAEKRYQRVREIFPSAEDYCKKYLPSEVKLV